MKLLYVESSLAIHGGIERVLTDKLNWLVEYGKCEVRLLLADQGDHPIVFPLSSKIEVHNIGIVFHQKYRYSGIKRYCMSFKLHNLFRERLHKDIETFLPDVIIFTKLEYVCDIMRVNGNIPVVYESHNSFIAYKFDKISLLHNIQIRLWYRALKKVQMIVALTNGDALNWKKWNSHVYVIPNVVHLNETGNYSDCSRKSVIFVGRYSMQKDVGSLLRIWDVVYQHHPDWQLHIYGGYGDEQDVLMSEMKHRDASIVVHLPTCDIHDKYIESSMLLLTSRYEPFGLVLPEAMSCGLPVVSFDCPYGPKDIITNGVDGFLVKDRDVTGFVKRVCQLIEDKELRMRMGQAAIDSSKRYTADQIMPKWKLLFENVCL